jgi:hypothetical protein
MNRVRIYAQFDLRQFFEIAKLAGFRLSLITGREAEEGKKNKYRDLCWRNPKRTA